MGTKKAVTRRRHVRLSDFVCVAKMRKVFGMCKGEGRKCVAEHVFCGKRKGSRVGEPWGCYWFIVRISFDVNGFIVLNEL